MLLIQSCSIFVFKVGFVLDLICSLNIFPNGIRGRRMLEQRNVTDETRLDSMETKVRDLSTYAEDSEKKYAEVITNIVHLMARRSKQYYICLHG